MKEINGVFQPAQDQNFAARINPVGPPRNCQSIFDQNEDKGFLKNDFDSISHGWFEKATQFWPDKFKQTVNECDLVQLHSQKNKINEDHDDQHIS